MANNQQANQSSHTQAPPNQLQPNAIAAYVRNQLLVNTRMSKQQRQRALSAVLLQEAVAADNVELPDSARQALNRELAGAAGTAMAGWRQGAYLRDALDSQAMGLPPPPPPQQSYWRRNK
jgi:hypothetical protein